MNPLGLFLCASTPFIWQFLSAILPTRAPWLTSGTCFSQALRAAGKLPNGQVPLLEVDGVGYGQSKALLCWGEPFPCRRPPTPHSCSLLPLLLSPPPSIIIVPSIPSPFCSSHSAPIDTNGHQSHTRRLLGCVVLRTAFATPNTMAIGCPQPAGRPGCTPTRCSSRSMRSKARWSTLARRLTRSTTRMHCRATKVSMRGRHCHFQAPFPLCIPMVAWRF